MDKVKLWKKHLNQCLRKERHGRVHCYGKNVTPIVLKNNQEIVVLHKWSAIEVNCLAKSIEGLEAMMKFMFKQQTHI